MLAEKFGVENLENETSHLAIGELLGLDEMPASYKTTGDTDDEEPPQKVRRV
jgi:hypothetical protein